MPDVSPSSVKLQECLLRFQAGDAAARDELVSLAVAQLTRLTRGLLRTFPGVRRWEETDDVLQNATLRLWQCLRDVQPRTLAEFFGLAAVQVRRELIDLARSLYGPEGMGAHHASAGPDSSTGTPAAVELTDTTYDPAKLAAWTEFHHQVDRLPAEEREVFDLLWYHELSQAEAAVLLGVSERTIRKRWRAARLHAGEFLNLESPAD